MSVRQELSSYLETAHPGCRVELVAGDASSRRFFRLTLADGSTRVVMDYGAPFEDETDDVRLNRVFRAAGLPVAAILGAAPDPGCLELQDLGQRTLEQVLGGGPDVAAELGLPETPEMLREQLYREAVRLAASVAVAGTRALAGSELADGPALDDRRFRFEMDFFLEHYVEGYRGTAVPPGLADHLHELAGRAADTPAPVFCHRDFHSRNLLVRPDGSLAMVDIQDARWGPDTYDVASLLRDPYVEIDEETVDRMLALYGRHLPVAPDPEPFRRRFDVVSAQRMIKALGTFGYQISKLGRTRYEDAIPRTLRRLGRLLPRREETVRISRILEDAGLLGHR